ncbi:MAG: glycosyltransferase family 39 protein [Chloroflexota bacterium]
MQATGTSLSGAVAQSPSDIDQAGAVRARSVAREGLKYALIVWLVVRLVLSAWGALIMAIAPEESHAHILRDYPDVVLPRHDLYGYTIGLWNIYDVRYYTDISERGYSSDRSWETAHFPGFPLMIKAVTPLTLGNSLLASFIIANVCAVLFFWFLYRLVQLDYSADIARRAVLLSAIFPSSFFLFLGYSEAPLLATMVAAIYYARQEKWWLVGVLAGGAALIKQPGVLILLPLAFIFWQQYRANRERWILSRKLSCLWLLLAPVAALSFSLYRYLYIATPMSDAMDMGDGQRLAIPGLPLMKAVQAIGPENPLLPYNLMDIAFTLLMIALVVGVVLKLRSTPYSLFAIAMGIVNLSIYMYVYVFRPEVNAPRRLLIIFPIFILLALVTESRRTYRMLAYVSGGLFLAMSGLFTNWIFVS